MGVSLVGDGKHALVARVVDSILRFSGAYSGLVADIQTGYLLYEGNYRIHLAEVSSVQNRQVNEHAYCCITRPPIHSCET
jgi:hypothetical protein